MSPIAPHSSLERMSTDARPDCSQTSAVTTTRYWRPILFSVIILGGIYVISVSRPSIWTYLVRLWTQEKIIDHKPSLSQPVHQSAQSNEIRQVNGTQDAPKSILSESIAEEKTPTSFETKDPSPAFSLSVTNPFTGSNFKPTLEPEPHLNSKPRSYSPLNPEFNANSIVPVTAPQGFEADHAPTDHVQLDHDQRLALTQKIECLEEIIRENDHQKIHKAQLWSRLQQLQGALRQSKNFEIELQQFAALYPAHAKIWDDLHILEKYAKTGMPSLNVLLEKFSPVKHEIIQTFEQRALGWHRLQLKLMPWIQILNTKSIDPTSINLYVLSQLEKAVIAQDFNQIVHILNPLSQQSHLPLFNIWQQQMQDYHRIKQIQGHLVDQTIADIVQLSIPKSTV